MRERDAMSEQFRFMRDPVVKCFCRGNAMKWQKGGGDCMKMQYNLHFFFPHACRKSVSALLIGLALPPFRDLSFSKFT